MRLPFICILFCFVTAQGQGLKVDGKRLVDAAGNEIILRGIGLGGWMLQEPYMLKLSGIAANQTEIRGKIQELIGNENADEFYRRWLVNHCQKADIDSLHKWGFNSIRLPMHYNLFTLPVEQEPVKDQNTWLKKGFALTDSLLEWCKQNKIYLILDLHAAPGGQGKDIPIADYDPQKPSLWQSEANRKKTITLWQKLAEHYAGEEWIGGYDLLNEPNWGFTDSTDKNGCAEKQNKELRNFLIELTSAIRQIDKQHIIFIEGNCWGNNYDGIFPLWDNNMVVSFHKYWNYNNQHSIQKFIEIRKQYNVPIWLGESGENSNTWFTNAIALVEQNRIGWAWWPLKKMGLNNPLQVKTNEQYEKILKFWRGEGTRPSPEEAFAGLMQLAEDAKIENNIYKKDVTDAMFRQVLSSETLPFAQKKIGAATKIFAADYDLGRSGFAYYDNDTANYRVSTNKNIIWNKGRLYRNDGVDIYQCNDHVSNGYCVEAEASEWLQYTINVEQSGSYSMGIRYMVRDVAATIKMLLDGKAHQIVHLLPDTGWKSIELKPLRLTHGEHKLTVFDVNGTIQLNYLQFQKQ